MKAFLLVILLSSGDDVLSLHSSTAAMERRVLLRAAATLWND